MYFDNFYVFIFSFILLIAILILKRDFLVFTLSNFIGTAGQASTTFSTTWDTTPLSSQITSAGAGGGTIGYTGNILSSALANDKGEA